MQHQRLRSALHYALRGAQDIHGLTIGSILKVLWLADVSKYVDRGGSVCGATYVRGIHGPVASELELLLQPGGQNTIINHEQRIIFGFTSNDRRISVTDAEYIDYWIACLSTCPDRMSETLDFAWKIALIGEHVPLYAVLANRICKSEIEDLHASAFTPHRHTLWTLAEHPTVRSVIETTSQHVLRSADMWAAAKWVLAHDPFRGRRLITEAKKWSITLHGDVVDMLPTVSVLYEIEDRIVVIENVNFGGPDDVAPSCLRGGG